MSGEARRGGRYVLIAASMVIVIAGLRAAATLILPILLACFLTILSLPLLRWMREHRVPVFVSVLLTVLAVVAVLGSFAFLVSIAMADAGSAAPVYLEQLKSRAGSLRDALRQSALAEYVGPEQLDPAPVIDYATRMAGGAIRGTVVGVATLFSFATLVLLALAFMLAEACGWGAKMRAFKSVGSFDLSQFSEMSAEVQHYLGIKTMVSLATGLLVFFWTWLSGLDFPLFWGLSAFVLNYIPTIGSMLAGVPAVILAWVQGGAGLAAIVALGYLAINLCLGNLLEPRLLGMRFRMSTLVVFLSLLFWGWVWGPLGMLLSVPLTRSLIIILEHTGDHEGLITLLGRGPVPSPGSDGTG